MTTEVSANSVSALMPREKGQQSIQEPQRKETLVANEAIDCNADRSDNESANSDDSEMEPFESYKENIEQLCAGIGLKDYMIDVIQHGYSYMNCVYSLTSTTDPSKAYILRVQQSPWLREDGLCETLMNDIATLEHLQGKLPVPKVEFCNFSESNPVGKPYTIQTRLAGVPLSKVYEDLSYLEKSAIIDQIVDIMVQLESVRFLQAGNLKFKGNPSPALERIETADLAVELFDTRSPVEKPEIDPIRLREREGSNLKSLLRSLIGGWIERERKFEIADLKRKGKDEKWNDDMSWNIPTFKRLLSMLQDLDALSAFKEQPFPVVIHHWDLEPRNILVEDSSGAWKISGVIDWDEAEAVPRPLARRPPSWMWDCSEEPETGFYDTDQYPDSELNGDNQALKDYFDGKVEQVLPGYLDDAYGHGRWLRRMFPYCKVGLSDANDMRYCKELVEQWEARAEPTASHTSENPPGQARRYREGISKWLRSWHPYLPLR